MLDFHHSPKQPAEDALCKLPEVQRITQQSRSWIYSDAGRAVVGPGFKLGDRGYGVAASSSPVWHAANRPPNDCVERPALGRNEQTDDGAAVPLVEWLTGLQHDRSPCQGYAGMIRRPDEPPQLNEVVHVPRAWLNEASR